MHENNSAYIKDDTFKIIIENTPLVSVDLIVKNQSKILLGKRINKPAQKYWFTLGGRVLKNEKIQDALKRIAKEELGIILNTTPKFIGVFEHLYHDSIFDGVSTHYINLGYGIEVSSFDDLPKEQHTHYQWFDLDELIQNDSVHHYVKDYFSLEQGTVPNNKQE
ncbi:MAG: NUDIX domain-containing protein [Campylobacterota bacterium]|nr:NUDIX domain-containing protein [Campylobacterota bacterium]